MPNRMEGGPMNMGKDSVDGEKPAEVESPVDKVKRLMHEHGIDERLREKSMEGPLAPVPEDEHKNGAGKTREQKPLSRIPGVITDAKAHERRITPPEKTEEDESSE